MVLSTLDSIKNFIKENTMCIVYFSSEACSVCHALYPKIEEALTNYPNIKLAKVEITNVPESAGEYSIFTFPTILIFIDGKEIARKSRIISIDDFQATVDKYYSLVF
ncbi:thioredoxin family protein [Caloramator proteoclasticus]|uniref:Thioredoxin n=1 Tax=Caloramator proteoclasticus DSM 10124 TaxID=1121262 RepID=A0A1M4XUW3_9CLOT|nr:thioredoxin family protein [Caloramator proteoclasticus]SHE97210.1 Thioredoxin [Caloramator proteoclasticus DSM 10124]